MHDAGVDRHRHDPPLDDQHHRDPVDDEVREAVAQQRAGAALGHQHGSGGVDHERRGAAQREDLDRHHRRGPAGAEHERHQHRRRDREQRQHREQHDREHPDHVTVQARQLVRVAGPGQHGEPDLGHYDADLALVFDRDRVGAVVEPGGTGTQPSADDRVVDVAEADPPDRRQRHRQPVAEQFARRLYGAAAAPAAGRWPTPAARRRSRRRGHRARAPRRRARLAPG